MKSRSSSAAGDDPVEASREQWNDGSNTLAIAPGKVCVYERNVVTNDVLDRAASRCVVPSEELSAAARPALHVHALRPRRHLIFGTVRPWKPIAMPVDTVSPDSRVVTGQAAGRFGVSTFGSPF